MSLSAAAMVCGIALKLVSEKGIPASWLRILSGMILLMVVIRPVTWLRLEGLDLNMERYNQQAKNISSEGQKAAQEATARLIEEQVEAYIGEKAKSMNLELGVEANVSDSDYKIIGVKLSGSVAPYERNLLSDQIKSELGIEMREQIWITPE